jgi:sugar lactone lactonase YvrE
MPSSLKFTIFWSVFVLFCSDLTFARKAKVDIKLSDNPDDSEITKLPPGVVAYDVDTIITASASLRGFEKDSPFSTLATVGLNYIRTLAGTGYADYNGDGINATTATLNYPVDLAVDQAGDIYIADDLNNRIRKITVSTGKITTVAGTGIAGYNGDDIDATKANLNRPEGVGVDGVGNVYIADSFNNRLRKVTVSTGKITTIAGTGFKGSSVDGVDAISANLDIPESVCVDLSGNIYIADSANHRIQKVSASTLKITTVAGTGFYGFSGDGKAATSAELHSPLAVAVDRDGNLYIADTFNHRLRKVTATSGIITTVAGADIPGFTADGIDAIGSQLYYPKGVAVDQSGDIFIADSTNYRIRKVIVSTGKMITIAGTGIPGSTGDGVNATSADLNYVTGIAVDLFGNFYIADTSNHRIRSMTGARRTAAPTVAPSMPPTVSATAVSSMPPTVSATAVSSMPPTVSATAVSSMPPTVSATAVSSMTPTVSATAVSSMTPTACPTASISVKPSMRGKPICKTKKPTTLPISAPPTNIKTRAPSRKCGCRKRSQKPSACPSK